MRSITAVASATGSAFVVALDFVFVVLCFVDEPPLVATMETTTIAVMMTRVTQIIVTIPAVEAKKPPGFFGGTGGAPVKAGPGGGAWPSGLPQLTQNLMSGGASAPQFGQCISTPFLPGITESLAWQERHRDLV